ncbi:patatin-like phospholipase family protein [Klebsiella sp. K-Nf6]|uniref:patatin-like phospholipase family protein n=1 Tax=Klebsiella sp. K-Nf6 TaxID=2054595 RepID=UPI000C2958A3|nr:patatin-like phospholipase family protein [Klebsiella sp. K-Nf6]PJR66751.1 patatin [Klebsiella sp. K-Nf6]
MLRDDDRYYIPDNNPQDGTVPYQIEEPQPENNVFEIALVMAGAISAGNHTAGALDFLFETLDAWEKEKAKGNKNVPHHKVRIRVIAGASAGSMNAAIAAGALQYDFPHLRPGMDPASLNNPFYTGWVKDIDISKLLTTDDIEQSGVVTSLLNCNVLQAIANKALNYASVPIDRPYLHDRVRFIFTQTSLQGSPYYFSIKGNADAGQSMVLHRTWASFSVNYKGQTIFKRRPDDIPLDPSYIKRTQVASWVELGNAALASGAFPLALAPRLEKRDPNALNYRFVITTAPGEPNIKVRQLKPHWPSPLPVTINEYIADGGILDNEPMELARKEMAGLACSNPRDGRKANRATILMDPFPKTAISDREVRSEPLTLVSSVKGIFMTAYQQLRFNPDDLALAMDDEVYSRFLISPVRSVDSNNPVSTENAMASGSLGGFGGFLSEEYRHHDYMLGRRNCQQFLREHFSLKSENPLFVAGDTHTPTGKGEYPIIPLVEAVQQEEPLPAWPTISIDIDQLMEKADKRLRVALSASIRTVKFSGFLAWFLALPFIRNKLLAMLINSLKTRIQDDLKKNHLPWH